MAIRPAGAAMAIAGAAMGAARPPRAVTAYDAAGQALQAYEEFAVDIYDGVPVNFGGVTIRMPFGAFIVVTCFTLIGVLTVLCLGLCAVARLLGAVCGEDHVQGVNEDSTGNQVSFE